MLNTNQTAEQQKEISWSYPTSENATLFGFAKGCWTVGVGNLNAPTKAVAAFAIFAEAEAYAADLPIPFSRWTATQEAA